MEEEMEPEVLSTKRDYLLELDGDLEGSQIAVTFKGKTLDGKFLFRYLYSESTITLSAHQVRKRITPAK